jgi:hypothetical protein
MATSGTIDGTLNAREIVLSALELLGVCALGDTPPAEESQLALKHLNWMLKTWQADPLVNGWRMQDVQIVWPADTATVTLDTNYLDLTNVRRQDASGFELPLMRYDPSEFAEIPSKTQAGAPLIYTLRKTLSTLTMTVWPIPTADTQIVTDGARVIEDVTDLSQTLDVPQEWLETVFTCLAARLALPLGVINASPATAAKVEERAADLYARLKGFDGESSSVFMRSAQW